MKMVCAILLLAFASFLHASDEIPYLAREYDPAKWPQATLKLSQAATLKDVFDSGLRPYRHPGLENTMLEVKHLNLTILLGSSKRLPAVPLEWMNVKVFNNGELIAIEAATPKLSLGQARQEMLKWLPFAENDRTEDDLDRYIKAVEADFLDFDDPYRGIPDGCGIGWKEPGFQTMGGGPKCGIGFRKTANPTQPLKLYFGFDWGLNRPQKDRGTYRPDPIPPPPGYEHVSMEAPKNFGPDSMVDIFRSKGVDIGESPEAQRKWKQDWGVTGNSAPAASEPIQRKHTTELQKSTSLNEGTSSFMKWLIVFIVIAAVLGLLWLVLKRRS